MKRSGLKIKFILPVLLSFFSVNLSAQTIRTIGSGGNFTTLKSAFDAINGGSVSGVITLKIISNTNETASAILNASGSGSASYNSVLIYPVSTGLVISGNLAAPVIDLNGADNITIDGRVNGSGSASDLTITNSNTSRTAGTSAIRFINDAINNTVRYCNLKGSSTRRSNGIILFSTTLYTTGNDGNFIYNNNITCSSDVNRPRNAIYSAGTAAKENSGNTINKNNIYNFLNRTSASFGINLESNTTSWIITDNSFYETASFVSAAMVAYVPLQINNTSGINFTVTGNYIGGTAPQCGGTAWTKTSSQNNEFTALLLNVGTATPSNVQNNIIRNFSWSNSSNASWIGINVSGNVKIGTSAGNTIGASTGTGSVIVSAGSTGANVYGIYINGAGTVECKNNSIGAVTTSNSSTNATNFYGISKTATAGTITIGYNTIGSLTSSNSINAASASTGNRNNQQVIGITNAGTGTIEVTGNIIANLTNSTTNINTATPGTTNGIVATAGTCNITNNVIRDLKNANNNTLTDNTASIVGISLTGATSKILTDNTIYNLSNSSAAFAGNVTGIYFTANTGANSVSRNFIHSLSVTGASSNSASIYGIKIASGVSTYSNNIISLSGNSRTTLYGIYDPGSAGNNINLYFNTIYLAGSLGSGITNRSYALYSALSSNVRNFRNNIFMNARTTSGGASLHYAAYFNYAVSTNLTLNFNNYFTSGTGGVPGYFGGANKTLLPIVTGMDANSLIVDPAFVAEGGLSATDYKTGLNMIAVSGTGISTDYELNSRGTSPSMGAWERNVNKWKGTTSNNWATVSNWTGGAVPSADANIVFDDSPSNHCYLDQNRSITNLINNQPAYNLVLNGRTLTLKGNFVFTNSAKVDASASGSTLDYAGTAAQMISAGDFLNNEAYNFTINNSAGVTLGCDFNLNNSLTINTGRLFSIAPPNTLIVSGSITNSGGNTGLVIRSGPSGDGKLINNNSPVNATVELYLSGGPGTYGPAFHSFVPPVQSMVIIPVLPTTDSLGQVRAALGLTPVNFGGDLVSYSEVKAGLLKEKGWQYFDRFGNSPGFISLTSAIGYNMYLKTSATATFRGSLNASDHTFSNLSYTALGWNLVGNPYPCNYDLTGISALVTPDDDVDNTAYYTHDGDYAYWNVETGVGTTGYSEIVSPMQGFFVRVTSTGKSLYLPAISKTASAAAPSRSKGVDPVKKIKLVLKDGSYEDETIVCFLEKATTKFDGNYDAFKLFGNSTLNPYIYTELSADKYAINSLKHPDSDPLVIPVTVVLKKQGSNKIEVTEFEYMEGLDVILQHGAIETILKKGSVYSFNSNTGTYNDFRLIISPSSKGVKKLIDNNLKTWYSNSFLYIKYPDETVSNTGILNIINMQGKTVFNETVDILPGKTTSFPINLTRGIYVTHILFEMKQLTSKIVVY